MLRREELQRLLASSFPHVVVPEIIKVNDEGVTISMFTKKEHSRPGEIVSGPTLLMLSDTVAYLAVLSQLGPSLHVVTSSVHIDFLRFIVGHSDQNIRYTCDTDFQHTPSDG